MRKLTAHARHESTFARKTVHRVCRNPRPPPWAMNPFSFYSTFSRAQEEIFRICSSGFPPDRWKHHGGNRQRGSDSNQREHHQKQVFLARGGLQQSLAGGRLQKLENVHQALGRETA